MYKGFDGRISRGSLLCCFVLVAALFCGVAFAGDTNPYGSTIYSGMEVTDGTTDNNDGTIMTDGSSPNDIGMYAANYSTVNNRFRVGVPNPLYPIIGGPWITSPREGTIVTDYPGAHGMWANEDSTAFNEYKITTLGDQSYGMYATSGSGIYNVSIPLLAYGSIETYGYGARGMVADGVGSYAENTGEINTYGNGAYGMWATGGAQAHNMGISLGSLELGGTIDTWGVGSHGMVAQDSGSEVWNEGGIIMTHSDDAYGMYAKDGAEAYNIGLFLGPFGLGGLIVTEGTGSHGMVADNNSYAENTGDITTYGPNAFGMLAFDMSEIYNYGLETIETWGDGSHGMVASNDSYAYNDGSIITHGNDAYGMYAVNASSADNYGGIWTYGDGSAGMLAEESSLVYNYGSIVTSGDNVADGMGSYAGSTAINSGDITTKGVDAFGMYAYDSSVIANNAGGNIVTSGDESIGMGASLGSLAVNSGSITTLGYESYGMSAFDDSAAYNFGSVTTSGDYAIGMHASLVSGIVNSGDIATSGDYAHGMYAEDGSAAENTGLIDTKGLRAYGMYAYDGSSADNTGTIMTSGERGYGMVAWTDSYAANEGTILTSGEAAYGMYLGNVSTGVNSGDITTTGANAHGMYISGGSEGANAGTITVTGAGSDAVYVDSGDFSNTGVLDSAWGNAVTAVNNSTITLEDGTVLVRSHILAGDGTSSLEVYMSEDLAAVVQGFGTFTKDGTGTMLIEEGSWAGDTYNLAGTLEIEALTQFETDTYTQDDGANLYVYANPDSATDLDAIPLWVNGDAWVEGGLTVDMATAASLPGFYTYIRADEYNGLEPATTFVNTDPLYTYYQPQWLEGGSYHYTSMVGYSFSEAALGLVAAIEDWSMLRHVMANHLQDVTDEMDKLEAGESKIHAQVLGGWTEREPSSELSAGYDSTQRGISIGFDKKHNDSTLWGVYAGYTEKDIDFTHASLALADWEKQDTWHVGAYISKRYDRWILSNTLTYRSTDHDTFRGQTGGDATAGFDSWAVTNDIRASYLAREIGEDSNWQVMPEIGLNIGYFDRDGYTEKNGFTYGDFDTTVVESVLGVRMKGSYEKADGSRFYPQFRVAWVHVLSGEDVTVSQGWGGDWKHFTETLDNDYFIADIGFSLYRKDNMDVSFNYGGRYSSNSTSHGGWLRFEWEF